MWSLVAVLSESLIVEALTLRRRGELLSSEQRETMVNVAALILSASGRSLEIAAAITWHCQRMTGRRLGSCMSVYKHRQRQLNDIFFDLAIVVGGDRDHSRVVTYVTAWNASTGYSPCIRGSHLVLKATARRRVYPEPSAL